MNPVMETVSYVICTRNKYLSPYYHYISPLIISLKKKVVQRTILYSVFFQPECAHDEIAIIGIRTYFGLLGCAADLNPLFEYAVWCRFVDSIEDSTEKTEMQQN